MVLNNSKKYTILIFIVILLGIFLIIVINDEKIKGAIQKDEYKVVNNASNFFTIEGCVNKYISSLYQKNTEDILTLLNEEYKETHGINETNIFNYIETFKNETTFNAKKMYIKDNTSFYVFGYLMEETIDSFNILDNYYLIVNINKENNTFNVTPYNGKIFIDKGDIDG